MSYKNLVGESITLNNKQITLTNYITCGGNSVVYECLYNNNKYIMKIFKGNKKKRYKRFKSEIDKINEINNKIANFTPKFITRFFPKFSNFDKLKIKKSPFYIIEKGEAYHFEKLTFKQKINNILEICEAVKQMHREGIIHKDIKPDNVIRYNGRLTLIDFGTASVPGIKTFDDDEPMGSRGTIAPEMINNAKSLENYKYEYADIYSLGKTMWIILTNEKRADKFTKYESSNINSKINLDNVPEGIIMLIEYILNQATQENFFKRITLDKMIYLLKFIAFQMINDEGKCNEIKFECLMKKIYNSQYDQIVINQKEKILEFIMNNISKIGIKLNLKENNIDLCDSIYDSCFEIKHNNNYFNFEANKIKFIFKIQKIKILENEIIIKTDKNEDILNIKKFSQIIDFERKTILNNSLLDKDKTIYLDCDICLTSNSNILTMN